MARGPSKSPFDIYAVGERRAAYHLDAMADVAEDARPFFRQLQDEIAREEGEWWRTHGRGVWPALSDRTRELKQKAGLDNGIMVATGALRASMTKGSGGRGRRVSKSVMHFSTPLYYAVFHNTTRPVRIPRDAKFRRMVHDELTKHLLEPTKRTVVE
jgi:hypothetical protein